MITRTLTISLILIFSLFVSGAYADGHTACKNVPSSIQKQCPKLKSFVDDAITYLKAHGEPALAVLGNPRGGYREGPLYIFVLHSEGRILSHAGTPVLVGKVTEEVPNGPVIWEAIREAASPEGGWAIYEFNNPETGKVEQKYSWVKTLGGMIVGAGIYD